MALAESRSLGTRILDRLRVPSRVLHVGEKGLEPYGVDLLGQRRDTAENRRVQRSNAQIVSGSAAVFAAVRWREQAITRPQIVLQQARGGEWEDVGTLDDPSSHPALTALRHVNSSTTTKQGRGGIERGKLTNGHHLWVKRRTGLGLTVEFEVWDGASVRAVARKDRTWEPDHFERRLPDGKVQQVGPEDVIWFRHIVDPRDPMQSLTPIGAIRVQMDSNAEALRHNQRIFDQGIGSGGIISPKEGESFGAAELERLRDRFKRDFTGTDNAHRWHFVEEAIELLATPQTNVDLQFADQLKWGVIEVARAMEVSPITLKDFDKATYTNADQAAAQDWETIRNQLDATIDEFNEFWIWPDFGEDFRLQARYAGITALQDGFKTAAEVDEIKLRSGLTTINELRRRDGADAVEWGEEPIIQINMAPLSKRPEPVAPGAPPPVEEEPPGDRALREVLTLVDQAEAEGWTRRQLKNAIRASGVFGSDEGDIVAAVERLLEHERLPAPKTVRKIIERDEHDHIIAVTEEVLDG